MILIKVNGKEEQLEKEMNLMEYVEYKGLNISAVVIEHNFNIIQKDDWKNTFLKENDTLEVLRFVGGG